MMTPAVVITPAVRPTPFTETYAPQVHPDQQAERFMRDESGNALGATGARLALQPPDLSLRVAKKMGLQDAGVTALDRYTRLQIVQELPSGPGSTSVPFWCNACSTVLKASRARLGGAVQSSAILRHLRSKHNLYVLPVDLTGDDFFGAAAAAAAAAPVGFVGSLTAMMTKPTVVERSDDEIFDHLKIVLGTGYARAHVCRHLFRAGALPIGITSAPSK